MRSQRGFTLLELLIVIAVIGILATVVIVSTSESRQKAKYAQVAQQLKEIEKAMILYAVDHKNLASWNGGWTYWTCSSCSTGGNLQLQKIIAGSNSDATNRFPGFNQYMSGAPESPLPNGFYAYTNKNYPIPGSGCFASAAQIDYLVPGVSLRIGGGTPQPTFDALDAMFDNSDGPLCGKILYDAGYNNVYYVMAASTNDVP